MKKPVNKLTVVYLKDSAGIAEGTVKPLPEKLANVLIEKGTVALEGEAPKPKAKAKGKNK